MDGVSRIFYFPQWNNVDIIATENRKELPEIKLEEIITDLQEIIKTVRTADGNDAILAGAYTDHTQLTRFRKRKRYGRLTFTLFPLNGQIVEEYDLHKGDFVVNLGRDPIFVKEFYPNRKAVVHSALLFSMNPFEKRRLYGKYEYYRPILKSFGKN